MGVQLDDGYYDFNHTINHTEFDDALGGDCLELDAAIRLLEEAKEKYKNLPSNQKVLLTFDEYNCQLGLVVATKRD
jgi:hypothetical protein